MKNLECFRAALTLLAVAILAPDAFAQTRANFPAREFPRVKLLLCEPGTPCVMRDFEFFAADLVGDGRTTWIVTGPRGECALQGLSCRLTLLTQSGASWSRICIREKPGTNECRGSASGVGALTSKSNGYRDLGSTVVVQRQCCAVEYVYRWNGREYHRDAEPARYLLYDENSALKPVPKSRWEGCLKDGKDCLN